MRTSNPQRSPSSESSESDVFDSDEMHRVTVTYGRPSKIPHHYSDESEQSSIGDLSDNNDQPLSSKGSRSSPHGKVQILRASSSSESEESDDSIDHIEQRIKKLEVDLEKRIDKHKKDIQVPKHKNKLQFNEPQKQIKASSPPLPKKPEPKVIVKNTQEPAPLSEQNVLLETNENLQPKYSALRGSPSEIKDLPEIKQRVAPKRKKEKRVPSEPKGPIGVCNEKKRVDTKNTVKHEQTNSRAHRQQIEELQRAVEELSENRRLRDQLAGSRKKKPVQQLDRLKQMTAGTDSKLQKQIELLKIIDSLQNKLKRSIAKKLSKQKGGTASVLLHKGLPSSIFP